jgi:hypothetical protein
MTFHAYLDYPQLLNLYPDWKDVEQTHAEWLTSHHTTEPRDMRRKRPKLPSVASIVPGFIVNERDAHRIYKWMTDEIIWFSYQFLYYR